MATEKFCLKWNEFEKNIRHSFRCLRNDKKLFDVTLATDDGHQVQAHRLILSAGSDFFNDIFSKCNQNNMLIYLKGISQTEIENIADFLYDGETLVTQHELNAFLETAQELKIKGLQSFEDDSEQQLNSNRGQETVSSYTDAFQDTPKEFYAVKEEFDSVSNNDDSITTIDDKYGDLANIEFKDQLEYLIEKKMNLWKCKICEKTAKTKQNIQKHAEIHIEGVMHTCVICEKTYKARHNLQIHITRDHSKFYSCNFCGRENMNKSAVYSHKKKCNGIAEEQSNV